MNKEPFTIAVPVISINTAKLKLLIPLPAKSRRCAIREPSSGWNISRWIVPLEQ